MYSANLLNEVYAMLPDQARSINCYYDSCSGLVNNMLCNQVELSMYIDHILPERVYNFEN